MSTASKTEIVISASDKTKQAFEAVEKRLSGLDIKSKMLGASFGALGGAFTVGAISAWTKDAIDAADALGDLSTRTGIAVEELTGWQYATTMADTSMEALTGALSRASKFMSSSADDLERMGISAQTSTDVILGLSDVISRMPADDPERLATAMKVLGNSASELMPLLSEGSEGLQRMIERGRDLNPITKQMVEEAGKFNDRLDELSISSKAAATALGNYFLPGLNQVLDKFIEGQREGGLFLGALKAIGEAEYVALTGSDETKRVKRIEELQAKLTDLGNQIEKGYYSPSKLNLFGMDLELPKDPLGPMARQKLTSDNLTKIKMEAYAAQLELTRLASIQFPVNDEPLTEYSKQLSAFDQFMQQYSTKSEQLQREEKKWKEALGSLYTDDVAKRIEDRFTSSDSKQFDQGQKYITQLVERIALVGKAGEAEQLLAKIESGSMQFRSASQKDEAIAAAVRLDLLQKRLEISKQLESANASLEMQFQALNDRLFPGDAKAREYNEQLQLLVITLDQEPRRLAESIERLNKSFYGDDLSELLQKRSEQFAALTDRLYPERTKANQYAADLALIEDQLASMTITADEANAAIDRLNKEFEQNSGEMSEFAKQAARSIQTTMGDTLYEGLNGRFDSIGESFSNMLTRMMADLAASQLADTLFGDFGKTGNLGGLMGSLFGGSSSPPAGSGNASPGITLNANGGVYDSPDLSRYSNSIVSNPTLFAFANGAGLMGEAGPEAILPLARGTDGKLGVHLARPAPNTAPVVNVEVKIINAPSQPSIQRTIGSNGEISIEVIFEQMESYITRRIARGQGIAEILEDKYGLNPAGGARG